MITVTCQYTGIEFQAESKRSKNHPAVSAFLNEAAKDIKIGAYAQAKQLVSEARGQFANIDDLMAFVNAAYAEWRSGAASPTVLTWKERVAIGNRYAQSTVRSMFPANYEEMTDGNAYSRPR